MASMNTIEDAAAFFPSFRNVEFLFHLFNFLKKNAVLCIEIEFYIALVGLVLTSCHVFVLTRKSMMMSSIISVMIGIGICDVLSMILEIAVNNLLNNFYRDECTPPLTLFYYYVFMVVANLRSAVIRCSTWLGLLMALIRVLILKFASNRNFQKFSKISFGFYATLISFLLSSAITVFNLFRTKIIAVGSWTPPEKCNLQTTDVWVLYKSDVTQMFASNNGLLLRLSMLIDGFLTRIIPCIVLPVLTLLLIIEIRKARAKMDSNHCSVRKHTERTTALVIIMTLSFFIASLPAGVFAIIRVMFTDEGFLKHAVNCIKVEFYIAIVGLVLTTCHVFVLTRKSMMMSSIISIMIGIGICDGIAMGLGIGINDLLLNVYRNACTPPLTLFQFYLFGILGNLRDDVIRCSTWLGVLMAFVRFSVLRFGSVPGTKNFPHVLFGFYTVLVSFVLSTAIAIFNLFRMKFVEIGNWTPNEKCDFKSDKVWVLYRSDVSDLFADKNGFLMRLDMALNAFFSKIFPCSILPILTVFLLIELRRARKTIAAASLLAKQHPQRTTNLVIFMTVTVFIATLPAGVCTLFRAIYMDNGFIHISSFVNHFSNIILTTNASIHCFVWYIMSADYRKTVKKILGIEPRRVFSNSIL